MTRKREDPRRSSFLTIVALVLLFAGVAAAAPSGGETATTQPSTDAAPERKPPSTAECLECHGDRDEIDDKRYLVDAAKLNVGPHAENDVSCVDCHTRAATVEDISDHGKLGPASCNACHEDAVTAMTQGAHAATRELPGRDMPTCATCHGTHAIRGIEDPRSPVYPTDQPGLCAKCHEGEAHDNFLQSVHGRALKEAASGPPGTSKRKAPTCWSCHGTHLVEFADVQRNPRFKLAMVKTCSTCHEKPAKAYAVGIHGTALLERQQFESASCVDCHRGHEIHRPSDPRSAVYATKVMEDCSKCHADAKLIRRFHLPAQVVESYSHSYHGLASQEGDPRVANCATCHEYHAVFPRKDPRSSVHPENLQKTCGKCHLAATRNFIRGKVHVAIGAGASYASWLVRTIYLWLIGIVIGGMLLHNILDFIRKMKLRMRKLAAQPNIERMWRIERITHGLLVISFITLAYSGFALLYPASWWAAPLRWISDTETFRKTLHRVAGVALILLSIHHLWFLFFHPRGREQRSEFFPRLRDVRQVGQNLLFYLGWRKDPPQFSRFSYIEKAEYWALVWGTAMMAMTGLVLWFDEIALRYMPRWLFDVCAAIHLYEAILAVLAIVVWHFYFVFVDPNEAPLATTFLDGRVSAHHVEMHRPAEYEQLVRAGKLPPDGDQSQTPKGH